MREQNRRKRIMKISLGGKCRNEPQTRAKLRMKRLIDFIHVSVLMPNLLLGYSYPV